MLPVYINNFNRLDSLIEMLVDFDRFSTVIPIKIYIIDNGSSRKDLLEFYDKLENRKLDLPDVSIVRQDNHGPRGYWGHIDQREPYYVNCDPDLDLASCPDDTLLVLLEKLKEEHSFIKVGLSIRLDDIPMAYPFRQRVLDAEGQFYKEKWNGWWKADIDTHFCLCRSRTQFDYGPALRSPEPYQCRHLPFYEVPEKITEDFSLYMLHLPEKYKRGLYWSTLTDDNPNLFLGDKKWKNPDQN